MFVGESIYEHIAETLNKTPEEVRGSYGNNKLTKNNAFFSQCCQAPKCMKDNISAIQDKRLKETGNPAT